MTSGDPHGILDLLAVIGSSPEPLSAALGRSLTDLRVRGERWIVHEGAGFVLRLRCHARPDGTDAVASWTAALEPGHRTLRSAATPLGLWPACAPDEDVGGAGASDTPGLLCRAVLRPDGELLSLTASVRAGRIVALTLFDEEPDWR